MSRFVAIPMVAAVAILAPWTYSWPAFLVPVGLVIGAVYYVRRWGG
jgi:hypothetical protein